MAFCGFFCVPTASARDVIYGQDLRVSRATTLTTTLIDFDSLQFDCSVGFTANDLAVDFLSLAPDLICVIDI
jgi:hypothetical protein